MANVNMTGTIRVNTMVRNRPSYSADIIGTAIGSTSISIVKTDGDWLYSNLHNGWIHANYVINIYNNDTNTLVINKYENQKLVEDASNSTNIVVNISESSSTLSTTEITDSIVTQNLNGIYGIPYQFMSSVDLRLSQMNNKEPILGRKYAEKIMSKIPLLCITPGEVEFMSNYSKDTKWGVLADLMTGNSSNMDDIITQTGRYYSFKFAYGPYFEYVNALCQSGAKFLNIQDVELNIGSGKDVAGKFDWQKALNTDLKATVTSQEFIGFYMDSTDSVSESFSNSTTNSQLADTLNGISAQARELSFLLGAGAGIQFDWAQQANVGDTMEAIDDISKQYLNSNTLFKTIGHNFVTIASGGKLLFPEIWADSEFSRDFDISIKLRTPDCDIVSWYLNIYVPLCHLIALVAGHQLASPNGYYQPFLVRAFYKGLFNIDMGIVTNMSIRKGKEAAWSIDGLPTEIDVDITIKDLYNMLSIVSMKDPKMFVTNSLLMNYIANTCGVNINQLDVQRSIDIYQLLIENKLISIPRRISRKWQDAVDTFTFNLYDKAMNKFLI